MPSRLTCRTCKKAYALMIITFFRSPLHWSVHFLHDVDYDDDYDDDNDDGDTFYKNQTCV